MYKICTLYKHYSTNSVHCQGGRGEFMEINKKLKQLRLLEGLTQQQLAEKLNLSRVNYTRYETGAVRPDYETLILLADFYDISLDELFDRNR